MIILAIIAVGITFYVFWTVVAGLFVVEVGKEIKKDVDKNLSSTTNSKLDAKLKKKGLEPFIPQTKMNKEDLMNTLLVGEVKQQQQEKCTHTEKNMVLNRRS